MADDIIKTKRITAYDEATSFGTGDWIFVDNTDTGTRKISAETIKTSLSTDAQIAAIQAKGAETLASIPNDYSTLSNSVSKHEEMINGLTEENVTFSDGYISSSDGEVKPVTPDAQVCSDFVTVFYGTYISALIEHSQARYRSGAIFAYDANKTYIGRIALVEGGSFTSFTVNTSINDVNTKYIRVSFSGYNDVVSTKVYVSSNIPKTIDEKILPINDAINDVMRVDGMHFQYINKDLWESGYYYNWTSGQTALVKNESSDVWHALKIVGLPAGTYYYNKFCTIIFSFIENISTGEIKNVSDIGIVDTYNGTITIDYDFNLWLTVNSSDHNINFTMFSNGGLPMDYVYGLYKKDFTYKNYQGQTVWTVGKGYIPTIQQACDMASPNDIIYIRAGTYTEQVAIWNKKLHLIGENKATTILIDHSGNYDTPPLEMSLGSLSNMTIIEDGTEPTGSGTSKYMGAYCIHIEWAPPANETLYINNCDFINYVHSPLGCGLYQDYTVHFKDCTFRCEASNEGNNERGSFYFHSNVHENVTGQKIIAENCIISSAGQKWSVLLGVPSGANNTGSAEARFSGCTIWNDNLGTVDSIAYFDTTGGQDVLKVVNSYGNTVSALNN